MTKQEFTNYRNDGKFLSKTIIFDNGSNIKIDAEYDNDNRLIRLVKVENVYSGISDIASIPDTGLQDKVLIFEVGFPTEKITEFKYYYDEEGRISKIDKNGSIYESYEYNDDNIQIVTTFLEKENDKVIKYFDVSDYDNRKMIKDMNSIGNIMKSREYDTFGRLISYYYYEKGEKLQNRLYSYIYNELMELCFEREIKVRKSGEDKTYIIGQVIQLNKMDNGDIPIIYFKRIKLKVTYIAIYFVNIGSTDHIPKFNDENENNAHRKITVYNKSTSDNYDYSSVINWISSCEDNPEKIMGFIEAVKLQEVRCSYYSNFSSELFYFGDTIPVKVKIIDNYEGATNGEIKNLSKEIFIYKENGDCIAKMILSGNGYEELEMHSNDKDVLLMSDNNPRISYTHYLNLIDAEKYEITFNKFKYCKLRDERAIYSTESAYDNVYHSIFEDAKNGLVYNKYAKFYELYNTLQEFKDTDQCKIVMQFN